MTVGSLADTWFRCSRPSADARVRLFCFPFAGGGAAAFHAWGRNAPPEIEVWGVQLPGREDRFSEPPLASMERLVESLLPPLASLLDERVAFLGYSMGALIAFELARRLRDRLGFQPRQLIVAARRAPHLPDPLPPTYYLAEDALFAELQRRYECVPDAIARDAELRELYLPCLRADLELTETYVCVPRPPLHCPIMAVGGRQDIIPEDALAAWSAHTTDACSIHTLPGGHFFLKTAGPAFLDAVVAALLPNCGELRCDAAVAREAVNRPALAANRPQ